MSRAHTRPRAWPDMSGDRKILQSALKISISRGAVGPLGGRHRQLFRWGDALDHGPSGAVSIELQRGGGRGRDLVWSRRPWPTAHIRLAITNPRGYGR